jgi:putative ABC transport system permease protein
MLKNYLKVALRNLLKHKSQSLINIFGLAVGLACCILIVLFVKDELGYDSFHAHADRIVRVTMEYKWDGEVKEAALTGTKVAPAFTREFPEVEKGVRIFSYPSVVKAGDKLYNEKGFIYADSSFFEVFSFELIKGDASALLDTPDKIVLTKSAAAKYFGAEEPIGRSLRIHDSYDLVVSGVVADVPSSSQIKFDMVASFAKIGASKTEQWYSANYITYLLLNDGKAIATLQLKIKPYMQAHASETGMTGDGYLAYNLQPLREVHLYSKLPGFEPNGEIKYLYIFSVVALLILVIACTNFMNMATARAAERAREVGLRKVIGANKKQLFFQFLGEAIVITIVAFVLSLAMVEWMSPAFNALAGKAVSVQSLFTVPGLLVALAGVIGISLLAGSYPAIILAAYKPINVLKGNVAAAGSGLWLRKGLIVFQFAISTFLIVCTLVINNQLQYMQNKKLGYALNQVIALPLDAKIKNNLSTVKGELNRVPGVESVTTAYHSPVQIGGGYSIKREGMEETRLITGVPVDKDFVQTLGLTLVAGRNFTPAEENQAFQATEEQPADIAIMLNETAVREMGWTAEEAIGKRLEQPRKGYIVGVVNDFHFASMHSGIGPLAIFLEPIWEGKVLVRVSGSNIQHILAALETTWKGTVVHRPFEFRFLDDEYNSLYAAEARTGTVFNVFALLAILLACLGLFGLAAFTTMQRTKEIGIRKVLGASVGGIVTLLAKDFLLLVSIAVVLATPLAWWAMHQWLDDFAYRVNVSIWTMGLASGIAICIAFVTVTVQVIKAASNNPVKSLRSE